MMPISKTVDPAKLDTQNTKRNWRVYFFKLTTICPAIQIVWKLGCEELIFTIIFVFLILAFFAFHLFPSWKAIKKRECLIIYIDNNSLVLTSKRAIHDEGATCNYNSRTTRDSLFFVPSIIPPIRIRLFWATLSGIQR